MEHLPLYIFIASIIHVTEEYFYPGGFLFWAKKNLPQIKNRINAKFAVIVNSLFILLSASGIFLGGRYPEFVYSIAGLLFVNGIMHIFSSIYTKSYSPGLISSIILYLPLSIYSFLHFYLSAGQILTFIFYGFLYHLAVPLFLFASFNKPNTVS